MLEEPTPSAPLPLEPALEDAQRLLRESLAEICHTDPTAADTGEMIRLDEMLAIAEEAAKRAVSLRRRMRQEGRAAPRSSGTRTGRRRAAGTTPATGADPVTPSRGRKATPRDTAAAAPTSGETSATIPATPGADLASTGSAGTGMEAGPSQQTGSEHRTFRDTHGVVWSVWAVHPQSATRRAGLRGTYVQGWLAFVCEVEKRRLSPVPDGWMEADDAELERLCATAEVAKPEALTRRMPPIKGDEA